MSSISEILMKSENPEKKTMSVNSLQRSSLPKKIEKIKEISSVRDILDKNSIDKSKLKTLKRTTVSSSPKRCIPTFPKQTTIVQKTDALVIQNPIKPIDRIEDLSVSSLKDILPIPLDLFVKPEEMSIIKTLLQKRFNVAKIEDNVNIVKIGISVAKRVLSMYNLSETGEKKSDSPYDNLLLC